jgi:hypothetical protein
MTLRITHAYDGGSRMQIGMVRKEGTRRLIEESVLKKPRIFAAMV